jgi:Zn-finger nucleic acid-binding protein
MSGPASCSSCRAAMEARSFARKLYGSVEVDLCFSCRAIWFDAADSMQLTPESVIGMFKLIHERSDGPHADLAATLFCPRCGGVLARTIDRVRTSTFNYYRCHSGHGHFITFAQFMTEKGFVRMLAPAEISKISEYVRTVRCTGCGAPVDIRKDSACPFCHAPIVILDPKAIETALAGYEAAAHAAHTPEQLAEVVYAAARARSAGQAQPTTGDLVLDSLSLISHLAGF